jgi:hypothetical protein
MSTFFLIRNHADLKIEHFKKNIIDFTPESQSILQKSSLPWKKPGMEIFFKADPEIIEKSKRMRNFTEKVIFRCFLY